MIKVEQLRNFISGNFTNAILSGDFKNDKIDLNLELDTENVCRNCIQIYSVDLKQIRKDPKAIFNYLLEKYLEYNTIIGVEYFVSEPKKDINKVFIIYGINSNLKIDLSYECLDLIPNDFVSKIEFAKKEGILKTLDKIEINKLVLHNFGGSDKGRDYKTGLSRDLLEEDVYHYYALRVEDIVGKPIHYESELNFTFKILELLCEKGKIDYEKLKVCDDVFKFGYYNRGYDYQLNDTICFNGDTNSDLFVYMDFLDKYLNGYKDEVKDNQMKLVLKRKGE